MVAFFATHDLKKQIGWELDSDVNVVRDVQVVGRAEKLGNLILDGANNPDGAQILAQHITQKLQIPPANLILVLGILADKDFAQMTQILAPLAKTIIVTKSNSPRAAATAPIAAIARDFCSHVEEVEPIVAAVERAKELAQKDDTILVTGSFTTIAEVPRPIRSL